MSMIACEPARDQDKTENLTVSHGLHFIFLYI